MHTKNLFAIRYCCEIFRLSLLILKNYTDRLPQKNLYLNKRIYFTYPFFIIYAPKTISA